MLRRLILFLALFIGMANSAPLLMLGMESDIDSNLTVLWEKSIAQILKEADFEPVKIEQSHFEGCENIDCAISAARASGAQGLFRGRLRAEGKDSISIRIRIDWLAGHTTPQTEAQSVVPFAWDETLKSGALLKLLAKVTGENFDIEHTKNKIYITKVETNPDRAVVMLNGNAICVSPCDFSSNGNMSEISAYFDSGESIWAAKTTTKPTEDTTRIYLELRRSFAGTEIRTNPSNAKIFPAEAVLNAKSKALGKTPYNLQSLPGKTLVRIFHEGYNDTLLNIKIDAVEKQIQFVQLTPITDPQKISEQKLFIKSQNKRNIGLGLLGGSVGPLVTGIVLCNLAQDDYKKARDIKNELDYPSFGGANYKAKIDENHKAVKNGNSKTVFGASLIGLSVLLAGVGFSMSF